jgi:radical SAM superfamily enzyme YgiQ (UPF0313 family)
MRDRGFKTSSRLHGRSGSDRIPILMPPCPRERVGFFIPRWNTNPEPHLQGVPFRCLPVAGALYQAGYEVVCCDQEPDLDRAGLEASFREALARCRVVFFWNQDLEPLGPVPNLLEWAARIRSWYPEMILAAGGGFFEICPEELLSLDGPFDFFFRGYGEDACPAFMAALRGEAPWDAVEGLVWNREDVRTNPRSGPRKFRVENLVPYRLLDMSRYPQQGGIFGNSLATLTVSTGLGCAKGCTFCFWRNHAPSPAPAEAIVDLVEHLWTTYGVTQYHLGDLDFFCSRSRVLTLARLWKERLPGCIWFALASPVDAMRFSDEEWDLLAAGGCRKLELGSESGSPRVIRALGKKHDADAPLVLTRKLVARGIVPMHNFIFGTVGETERDRRMTLKLIRRILAEAAGRVYMVYRLYQPCWNTPMGEAAAARSFRFPVTLQDILAYRVEASQITTRALPWLSRREERHVKHLANYYLPLVTSRLAVNEPFRRWSYEALRRVADLQLRTRMVWGGVDRWLYRRLVDLPMDNAFVCGVA